MNEKTNKFNSLEGGFLKMPREVLNEMIDCRIASHNKHLIFTAILVKAYFVDGKVRFNNQYFVCRRGEYVGSYKELSEILGLSPSCIGRYIRRLQQEGLLSVVRGQNSIKIIINNYDEICGVTSQIKAGNNAKPSKKSSNASSKSNAKGEAKPVPDAFLLNTLRPIVYDENHQLINDPEEARRVLAERQKRNATA